ncbi:MAG: hypothetical protein ACRDS9_08280, partial [Pseudonocardiaceae bacterium]
MTSELERIVQSLLVIIDQLPGTASQLRAQISQIEALASELGDHYHRTGDLGAARAAIALSSAAKQCGLAVDRADEAHRIGRRWAWAKVGSRGDSLVSGSLNRLAWPSARSLERIRAAWPVPQVQRRTSIGPLGPRTGFPPRGLKLQPSTAYLVDGRGTFYTDEDAKVVYVVTAYGRKGRLNPDLNRPLPDATFVVGGYQVFRTDARGRTVLADDPNVERRTASRSEHIQTDVGGLGGDGFDGGHLQQNATGGGPERINLVAMLEELNRSGSKLYGKLTDNYYDLEARLRDTIAELTE